jgi:hypothetical protein
MLTFIVVLGLQGWSGWFVWAGLLLVLGLDHPPTRDSVTRLDGRRMFSAAMTLLIMVLTFVPEPISFSEPDEVIPMFEGERTPIHQPARPQDLIVPI